MTPHPLPSFVLERRRNRGFRGLGRSQDNCRKEKRRQDIGGQGRDNPVPTPTPLDPFRDPFLSFLRFSSKRPCRRFFSRVYGVESPSVGRTRGSVRPRTTFGLGTDRLRHLSLGLKFPRRLPPPTPPSPPPKSLSIFNLCLSYSPVEVKEGEDYP